MARGITVKRVGHACVRTLRWAAVMLRNGRLPAGLGALALGAVLTFVVTDRRFTVDRVVVSGVVALPGATVAETTGVLGQSIFSVDNAAVARRVATLPAVRHVDVLTASPGTLVVRVDERQAALIWETANRSYLVDTTGAVLGQLDPSAAPPLPHLRARAGIPDPVIGERVDATVVRAGLALNARLPADVGMTEAAIVLDPTLGMAVQTARGQVTVGNDELLGRKLAVLKVLLRDSSWSDADIRDPDRPVLIKRQ